MKKLLIGILLLSLMGCSTVATTGKVEVIDGKEVYTPEEYLKITGQGSSAEFGDRKIKSGKILPDIGQVPDIRR